MSASSTYSAFINAARERETTLITQRRPKSASVERDEFEKGKTWLPRHSYRFTISRSEAVLDGSTEISITGKSDSVLFACCNWLSALINTSYTPYKVNSTMVHSSEWPAERERLAKHVGIVDAPDWDVIAYSTDSLRLIGDGNAFLVFVKDHLGIECPLQESHLYDVSQENHLRATQQKDLRITSNQRQQREKGIQKVRSEALEHSHKLEAMFEAALSSGTVLQKCMEPLLVLSYAAGAIGQMHDTDMHTFNDSRSLFEARIRELKEQELRANQQRELALKQQADAAKAAEEQDAPGSDGEGQEEETDDAVDNDDGGDAAAVDAGSGEGDNASGTASDEEVNKEAGDEQSEPIEFDEEAFAAEAERREREMETLTSEMASVDESERTLNSLFETKISTVCSTGPNPDDLARISRSIQGFKDAAHALQQYCLEVKDKKNVASLMRKCVREYGVIASKRTALIPENAKSVMDRYTALTPTPTARTAVTMLDIAKMFSSNFRAFKEGAEQALVDVRQSFVELGPSTCPISTTSS